MTLNRLVVPTVAAGLLAAAAAGCGNSTSASPAKHSGAKSTGGKAATARRAVAVGLTEWKIRPATGLARSGKVTFAVKNVGAIKHELVVLKTSRRAAALGKGTRVPETGNVGETGDLARGASKKVTFKLAPGHYSLVCNLPDHYREGMHADFTVR